MTFSFLEQSPSPLTLGSCFSPKGRVVKKGKTLEPGPLSSVYLLIIRLSLGSRNCKRLRGHKAEESDISWRQMPLLSPANPSTAITSCLCVGKAFGELQARYPWDASGHVTMRLRNLIAQPRSRQTIAHRPNPACTCFCKWSFICSQPYPFIHTLSMTDSSHNSRAESLWQTIWPSKLQIFIIWPFTEKIRWLLAQPIRLESIFVELAGHFSPLLLWHPCPRTAPSAKLLVLPADPSLEEWP